jgi:hypothetical protein
MRQPRGQDVLCVARRKQESFKTRYVGAKSDRTRAEAGQQIVIDGDFVQAAAQRSHMKRTVQL